MLNGKLVLRCSKLLVFAALVLMFIVIGSATEASSPPLKSSPRPVTAALPATSSTSNCALNGAVGPFAALAASFKPAPQAVFAANAAATAPHPDVPNGTRKLPPPSGSRKPVRPNPGYQPHACVAPVVNVSQTSGNESESFVVANPTNPSNIVAFSNIETSASIFRAYSLDGGSTWTRGTVATGVACCDGQATFDSFGNLFLIYINGGTNQINLILSTNGGVTFGSPITVGSGSIDQPSIAAGNGSLWVDWNSSGNMVARGAPVTGLGALGAFGAQQSIPNASGSFGGITVGPGPNGGKVMVTYMNPTGGEGPATVYVNVDADGLGAGGFSARRTATTTNVGGFDYIPPQNGRSIDAEAGLVWDATGGPFNNRAYLVYTEELVNESNDTEIYLRTSDDDGVTWSAPVRVNDDPLGPIRSQFLPYIALDNSSGTVAIGWLDSRNDNGVPGSGGTNNIPNDDAEYYASFSTNGGVTWAANTRLSGGFSNAAAAGSGVDYGDYVGAVSAVAGKFYALWADNSNCDGTNADGTLHEFDLYMGILNLGGQTTPTPTTTPTRTPTATSIPSSTATAIPPTPTLTPTGTIVAPTSTDTATSTPVPPTSTATDTPVPPTNTPIPATSTPLPSVTATICPNPFVDINGNVFYNAIMYLYCRGIVNGVDSTHYGPAGTASRAQFAKVVVLGFAIPSYTPPTPSFTDVPITYYAYSYIEAGYHASILSGYDAATCAAIGAAFPCYGPNRPITRAQLTKLVVNAGGFSFFTPTAGQTFTDVGPSNIFFAYVETAHHYGIINGYPDNTFRPNNNIRRDEMAQIVYKGITTPPQ